MTYKDIIKLRNKSNQQSQPSETSAGNLSYNDVLSRRRAITNTEIEEQRKKELQSGDSYIAQWFEKANRAVNRANNYMTNPTYNSRKNIYDNVSSEFIDLETGLGAVKSYVDKYGYTDKGAELQSMYSNLTNAMDYYKKEAKAIQDEMSQFSNETEYNHAVNQAKYDEKYKDYDYSMLKAELDKTDSEADSSLYSYLKDKSYEHATSSDLQAEYDALTSEWNTLHDSIDMTSEKFDANVNQDEVRNRLSEIEGELETLEALKKKKEYEEDKQKNYTDVLQNDVRAWTNLQQYYNLKTFEDKSNWIKNETGKTFEEIIGEVTDTGDTDGKVSMYNDYITQNDIDAYNYVRDLSQAEKDKITKDFENLSNKDELYKYFTREQEEKATIEQKELLQDYSREKPVSSSLMSIGLNTYGSIGDTVKYVGAGIDSAFGGDGYINPDTTNVAKAQVIRDTVSEDMNGVGKFLYNTGMSMSDFLAVLPVSIIPGVGQATSMALLGTSSGVSAANTVIENGGDIGHAIITGVFAGGAEAFFERFSLGSLKALKSTNPKNILGVVTNILKQGGVEASEEGFTELANGITDWIINADLSNWSIQYNNYLKQGYSEEEAWRMTAGNFASQIGLSMAGGFVSGDVMGTGASVVGYASHKSDVIVEGESIKNKENVSSLIKTAKTLSTDSKAYKLATKLEQQQKNGKKVSSSKVGELRSLTIKQSKVDYDAAYNDATKNLHAEEKAILDKVIREESLTPEEMRIVNDNATLSKSIENVKSAMKKQWVSSTKAELAPFMSIDDNAVDKSKLNISNKGVTEINDKEYLGAMQVVRTDPDTGIVTYKIEEDGKEVEVTSEEIGFASYEDAYLDAVASKHNVQTAQKLIELYEEGQVVEDYATEFNLYQNYGRLAIPLTDDKMSKGHVLNNDQKLGAYEVGVDSRKSYYQTQTIIANNAKNSKHYAYKEGKFNATAIKDIDLNDTQKAFYNFLREFALRTGLKIELFASEVVDGQYIGEQGSFNKKTGTIRIDINAGLKKVNANDVKHGMLNTFAHELTHIAELGEFYEELHDAVVKAFEKQGKSFDKLVENKRDKILRNQSNAKNMSEEKLAYLADTEVVADACETMLKNSKIFEDIAQGNPSLAQKIKNALRNFINRIKEMLGSMEALTDEGIILEKCVNDLEQIQKLWDKAVTSGIKTINASKFERKNNTDLDDGVKYSIRKSFYSEYDNWDGKNPRIVFNVGTTSKALQSIGLPKQNITWDSSKIIKIKSKHPEMVDSVIKQVPNIIEKPIIVMKSKSNDSRITLFGEVYSNNKPILAVIELYPQNRKGIVLDELKIASAYGKDNAQNLINSSTILYVESNKKRVSNWEKRTGLYLPVGSSLPNSNNSISSSVEKVNEDTTKFSMRDTEYMKAVENDDMETAQRLVDEAAKANGYNSPMLYHGTKSFGFTEFDLSKMDDGRSIFLTDSKRIASTYSGVEGTRRISESYDFDIDNMSPKNVVSKLNLLMDKLHKGDSEYAKYQYIDTETFDKLSDAVSKDIDYLKDIVSKKKIEYKNNGKIYSQLCQLYSKLDNRQYTNLSTQIYMLLHHTDVFENDNKNKIAEIEKNIRLFNKLELIDVSDGVILKDMLDGYSLDILYNTHAKEELEALTLQGNYSMYGNLDGVLVIDAKGAYWNNIRNWISNVRLDYNNTEVARENDEFFYLIDKRIGEAIPESWLDVNEHTKKMSKNELQSIMLNKANNILHIRTENVRTTRDIAKFAQDHGYSGVVFNNLADNGGQNTKIDNDELSNIYIFFSSSQIKSADPVTYDDNGNVIPLSERFDEDNNDIRYQYAGRKSKTANISKLQKAEEMEQNGIDSEIIRKETGWFRGYDKKWRYEIDDSKMVINESDKEYLKQSSSTLLEYFINHDELFKAYPQLRNMMVYMHDFTEDGDAYYNPKDKSIVIKSSSLDLLSDNSLKSILVHEIQHAIQDIEGFTHGSNTDDFYKYLRTAGEIEAYDVGDRNNFTAKQRKNIRPDIDREDVAFAEDEVKYQNRSVFKEDFNKYDDLTKLDTKQIKVYNDYGWTYQLFTAEDYMLLNEKFNEKYNLYKNQNDFVLGDGTRVVEVNNKLVLIGGSFKNPIIYDVFVVNSNNETEAEIYKELLLNDTEDNWSSKQKYIDICKSYEYYSEEETVRNYESTDFSYHKGQKDTGERAVLPQSFKNYGYTKQFQNRGRNNSEAEQGISNNQVDEVFQMRTDGTYSNRTLLANALESSVQNEVERNLIKAYKEGISQLDEMETKLRDVKAQIKEISFTKNSDRSQLLKLNNQKKMLTEKIARKDKQLLKLESMESMQKLIALEKDKATKRATDKMNQVVKEVKKQERERAKKLVDETREKYQKTLQEVRESRDKKIIAEREKRKSQIKKFRNNRERTEYVEKIRKLQKKFTQMLLNPTDKSFVIPDCLKGRFPEACKLITDAVILDSSTQAGEALEKVSRAIAKLIKDNNTEASLLKDEFSTDFKELVDTLSDSLKDKKIGKNLTLDEAEDIYNILKQIYDVVRTANKMLSREDAITISESSEKMIDELGKIKENKGVLSKGFMQILSPIRVAQMHSGYSENSELMNHIYNLDNGEIKASEWDMNARKPFEALGKSDSKAYDEAITEVETIEYIANDGDIKTVKMTRMQGMQILLSWEREAHNPKLVHMQTGGIVLPDAELMAKGKFEEAYDKKQTINGINYFFVKAIADTMTDFDWLYMGLAKKYFNDVSKKAINEVSLKLKHREVATENHYIPFSVDNRYLATEYESVKFDATLENAGKLKSLVVRDSKPIVIAGLNNVLNRDISDTARLYGLAVPLRDFKKSFKLISKDSVTIAGETSKTISGESARGIIEDKWGKEGSEFYKKLVSDLTTERKSENPPFVKPLNKLRSAKITSVFTANLGITIKQLSAYPSALAHLSHKALAKGLSKTAYIFKNWDALCEEIDSRTPLHYKRRKGLSSREMSEFLNTKLSKKMKNIPSVLNPTKWIQCMDCYITAMHWEACKAEIASKFEVGTEEYWDEVTNLYNKVINDTQQNYDVMHTAEVTKSKNGLWENLFMFRTEPLQHTGVLYESVMEYSNTKSKESKSKLVKAIASQIESAVVYAGLGAFVALLLYKLNPYKDEDDEITPQSVLTEIGTDIFENIAGLIAPIGGESIAELISALVTGENIFDTELMVIQVINDLNDVFYDTYNTVKSVAYKLSLGLEVDYSAVGLELWESVKVVLESFGVPLQNIENIFTAIPKWVGAIPDSTSKPSSIAKQYGNAYTSGDTEKAKEKLESLYQQKLEEFIAKKESNPEDFKNTTPEKKAKRSVRDALVNVYKKEYQEAFLRNDTKRMQEIVNLLQSSGYMRWENQLLSEKLSDWRKSAKEDLSK